MRSYGWRAWGNSPYGSSAVMLSTYPIARLGDISETPPEGETWLLLGDYDPLWTEPGWANQFQPLPTRLPAESGIEGFGSGRNLSFKASGHAFQAFIKGNPRSAATLGILRSIRFTAFGRPARSEGLRGFTVTNRIVNGPEPLAADLWVIERLRGREDILARLQRRLKPEATIRLGSISDPERWTRRVVALAR